MERISKCHSPSDPVRFFYCLYLWSLNGYNNRVNICLKDEARRVEEAGGCIMSVQGELRVNAVLNVTRSLGKKSTSVVLGVFNGCLSGDVQGRPMIISVPDTTLVERGSAGKDDSKTADILTDGIERCRVRASAQQYGSYIFCCMPCAKRRFELSQFKAVTHSSPPVNIFDDMRGN